MSLGDAGRLTGVTTSETTVRARGAELCAEAFGRPSHPTLLLIQGAASAMDFWEDEFCARLVEAGRFVIRYDHRDTGRSTSYPPGEPGYTGRDLTDDAWRCSTPSAWGPPTSSGCRWAGASPRT